MDRKIKVGYLFSKRKAEKLKLESIVKKSKRNDLIELTAINPYKSLKEQSLDHIDIIIHRIHDCVNNLENLDADNYVKSFLEETTKNNIKLLSPLNVIQILSDRMKYMSILMPLVTSLSNLTSFTLKLPPMLEIHEKSSRKEVERLCNNFKEQFLLLNDSTERPFIVKTTKCVYADESRYKMCLYFHMDQSAIDGIMEFVENNSIILQPFYNHDGCLYKLFILGDKWHLGTRPSIKNFDFTAKNDNIIFHSNKISKIDSGRTPLHYKNKETAVDAETSDPFKCHNLLPKDIGMLTEAIKNYINSPLLGVDMLMECNTRDMYIIDVNYFPGYDGFSKNYDLGESFIDLFLQYAKIDKI